MPRLTVSVPDRAWELYAAIDNAENLAGVVQDAIQAHLQQAFSAMTPEELTTLFEQMTEQALSQPIQVATVSRINHKRGDNAERNQNIVRMVSEGSTLREVAEQFSISRGRVSQILAQTREA